MQKRNLNLLFTPEKYSQQTRNRSKILTSQSIEASMKNLKKGIYENCIGNITLNCERLNEFSPEITYKTRMSTLTSSIQNCTGNSDQWIQARKGNKRHLSEKERNKNYVQMT